MITSPDGETLNELEGQLLDLDEVSGYEVGSDNEGWAKIYLAHREALLEKISRLKTIQIYE